MLVKNFNAQFWSFDAIFAIVIFGIALMLLAYTWYSVNTQLSILYGNGATVLQIQAQSVARQLLTTGAPSNWQGIINVSNTVTWTGVGAGLAISNSGVALSTGKIYALMAMSSPSTYQLSKQMLGVGYDYYIEIIGNNYNITMGENPSTHNTLTTGVYIESATINGAPVTVVTMIWTNQPLAVS